MANMDMDMDMDNMDMGMCMHMGMCMGMCMCVCMASWKYNGLLTPTAYCNPVHRRLQPHAPIIQARCCT